jgi:ribokinase
MSRPTSRGSPAEVVLRNALEKLRGREGLTESRIRSVARDVSEPLLQLASVRRYASVHKLDAARAVVTVVAECVHHALNGTDRIVADAVLGLGTLAELYLNHGIADDVMRGLRSALVKDRRDKLLVNWVRLHEAVGVPAPEPPPERELRVTVEAIALAELAHQLIRREHISFGSISAPPAQGSSSGPAAGAGPDVGRVIVIGGAVMDATFQTTALPQPETSREAYAFHLSPGGKGLTQAVAAARLGLRVSLVAAVANDDFGQEILGYLEQENVDTSMVKRVDDARSAFTGVIELELGDSIAVNWRNEREVRLDLRDLDLWRADLQGSDAVLLTFEIPRATMQGILTMISRMAPRPIVIVTPSQPYTDALVPAAALDLIDYLVAHAWELRGYAPKRDTFDLDAVALQLLAYGVETLCVPTGSGCTVYSETRGTFAVPSLPSAYKESSAARDAFCAALAAKLIDAGGEFSEDVALWATAAMAAATADHPLPNSMPDRRRVEQMLSRSRFVVTPKTSESSDGSQR